MCLIVVAFRVIRGCPVFLAANREELRTRPSTAPENLRESDGKQWIGGRDRIAGGTWLGVNSRGLVVAVTNRNDRPVPSDPYSRGLLCRELLACDTVTDALTACRQLLNSKPFNGFNLLAANSDEAAVVEVGRDIQIHRLSPGLHVLTNSAFRETEDVRAKSAEAEFTALLHLPSHRGEGGRRLGEGKNRDLSRLLSDAASLCGRTSDDQAASLCRPGGDHGTVSSSVIALPEDRNEAEYWFADGPPSNTPFHSYSHKLHSILKTEPAISSHRINLKGPWEYEWADSDESDPENRLGRVTMPADWRSLFENASGRATFRRRFNSPTNLTPDDRIFIVFDGVGGNGAVALNGIVVGEVATSKTAQRFVVTDALQRYNELTVELDYDSNRDGEPGGLFAPVALVIESPMA